MIENDDDDRPMTNTPTFERLMSNGEHPAEYEPVERKVQLAGNSTFVVSLPKEWARAQDLESGASMYLYPTRID